VSLDLHTRQHIDSGYTIGNSNLKLDWFVCSMINLYATNHFGGVMVNVLDSSVVDRGFEVRSSQIKD
jgi:hypothetical protein